MTAGTASLGCAAVDLTYWLYLPLLHAAVLARAAPVGVDHVR